jgi:hypothetical protein
MIEFSTNIIVKKMNRSRSMRTSPEKRARRLEAENRRKEIRATSPRVALFFN